MPRPFVLSNRLHAAILAVVAVLFFSLTDALGKLIISQGADPMFASMVRFLCQGLLVAIIFRVWAGPARFLPGRGRVPVCAAARSVRGCDKDCRRVVEAPFPAVSRVIPPVKNSVDLPDNSGAAGHTAQELGYNCPSRSFNCSIRFSWARPSRPA